jgi:GAF domain-containing protein
MKADLKNTAEEDKKRNWTTEGLAKFGDILRNNTDDLAALANNIISNLVKYIGANQGGLFVINDHNTNEVFLELIACYAWEKKKFIEKKVQKSEGLVGQVWQEGELIYITDIPQDFIKITSGLGGANPNSILVVPLKVNEETYGVIELASFQKFEQYQIDFMTKLAESIASTLAAAKTNERTKFLLEQSQQQTEEMRAQEE